MTYNPNAPNALGLEYPPTRTTRVPFSNKPLYAYEFDSTVNETITQASVGVTPNLRQGTYPDDGYFLEIYPSGLFQTPSPTVTIIRPTSVDATANFFSVGWDGTTNSTAAATFPARVNNATQTPVNNPILVPGQPTRASDDYIYAQNGSAAFTAFFYPDVSASLAGQYIYSIRQVAIVNPYDIGHTVDWTVPSSMTVGPRFRIPSSNKTFYGPQTTVTGAVDGGYRIEYDWLSISSGAAPNSGRPWRVSDLSLFNGLFSFGWATRGTGDKNLIEAIMQEWIEIVTYGPDQRVALSDLNNIDASVNTTANPSELVFGVKTPTGGSWSKSAGQSYRIEIRKAASSSNTDTRYLKELLATDTSDSQVNSWRRVNLVYEGDKPVQADPVDDELSHVISVSLFQSPTVQSLDSQTYQDPSVLADFGSRIGGVSQNAKTADKLKNGYWEQTFTTPAGPLPNGGLYDAFRMYARLETTADLSDSVTLTAAIYNNSNVKISSDFIIRPSDIDIANNDRPSLRDNWTKFTHIWTSPPSLSPTTVYKIRFTQTGSSTTNGWDVLAPASLNDDAGAATRGTASFGGRTYNLFTRNGTKDQNQADISAILSFTPAAPGDFEADIIPFDECVQQVALSWTSPGGNGNGYELQRSDVDPVDGPWYTIATFDSINATDFIDVEMAVNRPSYYRVRTTNALGFYSDWSPVLEATALMTCCGYLFSTNMYPDIMMWAFDISDGVREFTYPQNVTEQQFYNRDFQILFQEKEFRGVRFKRTLMIAADQGAKCGTDPTPTPGQQTFFNEMFKLFRPGKTPTPIPSVYDDVEDRTVPPYICVVDEHDRWFGTVLCSEVRVLEEPGWYEADIEVIETTAIPLAVESAGCTQGGLLDVVLQENSCAILLENNDFLLLDS